MKKTENTHTVVLLYVDDMIVTGSNEAELAKLRAESCSLALEVKK